ncbi:hypothetical protein GDO81_027684 [Engystomops pustulosus]|uniref:Secreted protein n=1 Tax=Engystomops pustulosus TaxID=76066 RepID=A0AAV6YF47_ENGPU|nr:hypothetical protein GDO81_027684 [Engystomops pustulosus]
MRHRRSIVCAGWQSAWPPLCWLLQLKEYRRGAAGSRAVHQEPRCASGAVPSIGALEREYESLFFLLICV